MAVVMTMIYDGGVTSRCNDYLSMTLTLCNQESHGISSKVLVCWQADETAQRPYDNDGRHIGYNNAGLRPRRAPD